MALHLSSRSRTGYRGVDIKPGLLEAQCLDDTPLSSVPLHSLCSPPSSPRGALNALHNHRPPAPRLASPPRRAGHRTTHGTEPTLDSLLRRYGARRISTDPKLQPVVQKFLDPAIDIRTVDNVGPSPLLVHKASYTHT